MRLLVMATNFFSIEWGLGSGFGYHPMRAKIQLTDLCLTADLVVFSQVLEEFKEMSGMAANSSKSEVLFSPLVLMLIPNLSSLAF